MATLLKRANFVSIKGNDYYEGKRRDGEEGRK